MTQSFTAHCLTVHNPFHPMLGRETQLLDEPVPIRSLVPPSNKPVIVVRNGQYILRADWDQEVKDGDTLAVVFLPQGGDDGASDVLKVVLIIVIAYFSGGWGASLAEAYGGTAAAWSAAISVEGTPVINAIIEVTK